MRPLTLDDVPICVAIDAAAFHTRQPWGEGFFTDLLRNPTTRGLLTNNNDGVIMWRHGTDEGEIYNLAVHPRSQRQGLARTMLDECEKQLKAVGAARVILDVAADNAPAITLYEGAGYRRIACRAHYYAHNGGTDAWVLEKHL